MLNLPVLSYDACDTLRTLIKLLWLGRWQLVALQLQIVDYRTYPDASAAVALVAASHNSYRADILMLGYAEDKILKGLP